VPLRVEVVEKGNCWRITADFAREWRMHSKTYCFSDENRDLEFHGHAVRIRCSLFPRPNASQGETSLPVFSPEHNGALSGVDYRLTGTRLELLVHYRLHANELNAALPWSRTSNNKISIKWRADNIRAGTRYWYDLQLLVTFTPPPRSYSDTRVEFPLPFLVGGRPETNRRKF
jgi:hypothetical protein